MVISGVEDAHGYVTLPISSDGGDRLTIFLRQPLIASVCISKGQGLLS